MTASDDEAGWGRFFSAFHERLREAALSECLESDSSCAGPVIRAHTVQNALVLEGLAVDGHVVMFQLSKHGMRLERVGRNKATTFTGYCSTHDTALFKAIDFGSFTDFQNDDLSQAASFAMRALAKEYWEKLNVIALYRRMFSLGAAGRRDDLRRLHNMTDEELEYFMGAYRYVLLPSIKGSRVICSRLERSYRSLRRSLQHGEFHLWRFFSRPIACPPCAAVAAAFYLERDVRGNIIGTTALHEDTPLVVLNIVPLGGTTWVLIAYHRRFADRLARTLLDLQSCDEQAFGLLLSRMLVIHCGSVVLSPHRVTTLTADERRSLEKMSLATTFERVPYHQAPPINFFTAA